MLEWLTIFEVDEDTTREAADVQADALLDGHPFPDIDLLITLSGKSGSQLLTLDKNQLKIG